MYASVQTYLQPAFVQTVWYFIQTKLANNTTFYWLLTIQIFG